MPVIARFYGIVIKMYFREHCRPHFHAIYAEFNGVYDIETLELIEGDLPARAHRLVVEWAEQNRGDLQRMWSSQQFQELPGLEYVRVEPSGYAIAWNDRVDLAESELWLHGESANAQVAVTTATERDVR